jgi:hypothetical protein
MVVVPFAVTRDSDGEESFGDESICNCDPPFCDSICSACRASTERHGPTDFVRPKIIGEEQFFGLRILYDDTAEALAKGNQTAQRMCTIFNEELAPMFEVEPITPDELDDYLRSAAPREAETITTLARAKAEFDFGNRLTAYPLIAKAIQQSAQPLQVITTPCQPVEQ